MNINREQKYSFNQFYMAGFVTASMIIIEVPLMNAIYFNKNLNTLIVSISVIALLNLRRQSKWIKDMIKKNCT